MSKKSYTIREVFSCPYCNLIYYADDNITIRKIGNKYVHDCDNCLAAIDVKIVKNKIEIVK